MCVVCALFQKKSWVDSGSGNLPGDELVNSGIETDHFDKPSLSATYCA